MFYVRFLWNTWLLFRNSLHKNLKVLKNYFFLQMSSCGVFFLHFFIFRESALAAKHSCEVLKDKPIERVQRSNNTKETTPTSKVIDYFDFSTQWSVPLDWTSVHLLFRDCFISCIIYIRYSFGLVIFFLQILWYGLIFIFHKKSEYFSTRDLN